MSHEPARPEGDGRPPNGAPAPRNELPPIATLLTPAERTRVDAAGEGCYQTLHRESVEDVVRDLRSRQVHAVLVSVTCAGVHGARVASMVREFPRVPAVALLSELEGRTPHTVLSLGQSGIRRLVDVRQASGWRELRGALLADAGGAGQRGVLGALRVDLAGATDDCWEFFQTIFTCSPRVGSVRQLARELGVLPSTLMSRFFRAGLPAPKRYLAMARLVRAARLFENSGFSIANVSNHLEYSSPQSFGRHVRTLLGITAGEFRHRYDGAGMIEHFREVLVLPYLSALRVLRPASAPPGWVTVTSGRRPWAERADPRGSPEGPSPRRSD
ncbi:MAG: Helix-turn-helix, AraC protein [Gemmatimonadetes bacterium]|jgi:AraC-like DNA-binding protein|nr:Helix-turn-helix, AraC protein [Gemmatimonadota bacterium]